MNFQKNMILFNNPRGYIDGFKRYLLFHGSIESIEKSVGGIVNFHQLPVNGVGNVTFFQGQPDLTTNTNLNNFDRPQSEHMIITHLRLYEGTAAAVVNTAWTPGVVAFALQNGDLTFLSNGVVVENRLPNTIFTQAVENPFSGFYEVPFPIIWKGQTQIEWRTQFRTDPAVANQNLRAEVWGLGYLA